jgi:hypothetical protein
MALMNDTNELKENKRKKHSLHHLLCTRFRRVHHINETPQKHIQNTYTKRFTEHRAQHLLCSRFRRFVAFVACIASGPTTAAAAFAASPMAAAPRSMRPATSQPSRCAILKKRVNEPTD